MDPGIFNNVVRAKKQKRLPVVCTALEVKAILNELEGVYYIMVSLLYGSGLKLTELLMLRVKDVDFYRNQIIIRSGKGFKDRVTMLPIMVKDKLKNHLEYARTLHEKDLEDGFGNLFFLRIKDLLIQEVALKLGLICIRQFFKRN